MMDFVCVCVRVPKSGSQSLSRLLAQAFAGRRTHYLPDTLNPDGMVSRFQHLRFRRTRARNLMRRYGTANIASAFARIGREAADGDLIDGGHIDIATVRANLARPVKLVTLLRDPVDRSVSEYNYARMTYFQKNPLSRLDAGLMPKMAARYSYDGFLDFLLDHGDVYGNIASRYIGWDGAAELADHFAANVFHSGVLEESDRFAARLSEKLGMTLEFPYTNRTEDTVTETATAAQRVRIGRLYGRDIALYEWLRGNLSGQERGNNSPASAFS